jgi:alkylation response protein AidB-like acyl-CoA dehydrogenase
MTGESAGHSSLPATSPPTELDDYRKRLRALLATFSPQTRGWESSGHLSRDIFASLGQAGVFTERWRLGPLGGLPYARVLVEELALLNGGAALEVSLHCELFVHALHRFGGEQHADVLRAALAGETIGCIALTESHGGSDLTGIHTQAVRDGRGWRLIGTKRYTTNIGVADNVLVLAKTGSGGNACAMFRIPLNHPGVRVTGFFGTLGVRAADTGALELDTTLSADHLMGRAGAGLLQTLKILTAATGLIAGTRQALGLARAYMRTRTQFGNRLYDHQALCHAFAERWADIEAAAALLDSVYASGRRGSIATSSGSCGKACRGS